MQSQTGAVALKHINKTKGQIKALEWVLEDKLNICPQCGQVKYITTKFCVDCTVSKHIP